MKSLIPIWVLVVMLTGAVPLAAPLTQTDSAPTILGRFELMTLPGAGRSPLALAILNDKLYVANRESDNVAVIQNDRAVKFIPTARAPLALTSDPDRNRLYVATYVTPTVALIENDSIVKQVAVEGRVNALAVNGDDLYVALDDQAIIEQRDAHTLEKTRELKLSRGFNVRWLIVDSARGRLYASVYESIAALDLNGLSELFWVSAPYHSGPFALNSRDGSIWTDSYDESTKRNNVLGYAIDGKEIARFPVESSASTAAFDDEGRLYILDAWLNKVSIIDIAAQRVIATLPLNEGARDALFDPRTRSVYITNSDTDNLTVIDVNDLRVRSTIHLAMSINALLAAPDKGWVYAANGSTNSVFVIGGQEVVQEIPVGNNPVDLARDPVTQRLFVASRADGALTIIDENKLRVMATTVITSYLQTVATDPIHRKLFASSLEYNLDTMQPGPVYLAQGITLGSLNRGVLIRANNALEKIYSVAYNGVPGSNSRNTLYAFMYNQPGDSKPLGSRTGGNTTALAIDPSTNYVYATSTHPLAYTHGLDVFDGNDNLLVSIPMGSHTRGMILNPQTHHIILSHSNTFSPYARSLLSRDNTLEILDTRTLGRVAFLDVPGDPAAMTLLGNTFYIAGSSDGVITLIEDVDMMPPNAPTPTLTPSPYPTWTPTLARTPVATRTSSPQAAACTISAHEVLSDKARSVGAGTLGCATAPAHTTEQFAFQPFARGFLVDDFRDENAKKVYAFFDNGKYQVLADTWHEGDAEVQCPEIPIETGRERPKRGFGKVWCEHAAVRALGGGLEGERAVEVLIQPFERGVIWSLAGVGVYVLFDVGTWR